nr:reverse transcriptase domain-containing protein [Tanacetum cinerariifolium]
MDENFGNDDNHRDNLDEMLHNVESNVDEKNVKKLQQLFDDAEKPLFEGYESSCVDGSGAGLILASLEGTEFTYALRFQFIASKNEIVAMEYFTKWIEAKAVTTITGSLVKKFMWDNIVCCFGLPGEIVSDNGKQFCDNPFKDWCDKLNITQRFALVKYPQSNGLVERENKSLGEGIKACLNEGNKN